MDKSKAAIEMLKCKRSPFYFIYNYCRLPEVGGSMQMTPDLMHPRMVETIKSTMVYHKTILMATRQLGKSSLAAMLFEYTANFFPGTQMIIINATKSMALENIQRVKFIHDHLPSFLKVPLRHHGDRKTYMEYENGSIIKIFYPSTTTSPDLLARSLTAPCMYIDEGAFIPHIAEAYAAALPVLSKAREQAQKNNYPYFILITSTPNGSVGTGRWFHDMWANSLPSEQIFTPESKFEKETKEIIKNPTYNSFIRVRYHWSEIKSQEWYTEMCREFNFDTRKINQELDLLFVGGTSCIFSDEFLSELKPSAAKSIVSLPTMGKLSVYVDELDAGDYYIIGVDSAKSITGDYCAIEVVKYSTLEQVAEYYERVGSITRFAENIMVVIDWIEAIVGKRYVLAIENNNVGSGVIEELEKAPKDYVSQMYNSNEARGLGINTNSNTKGKMISYLYDYITPKPRYIHSIAMINQFSIIEKKANGSISAQRNQHDDLFMAYALTSYAKKMTMMEIEPRLNPEISRKLDKDESKVIQHLIGPAMFDKSSNFSDMVNSMSDGELQNYAKTTFDDELDTSDMSSIIGDIFGG